MKKLMSIITLAGLLACGGPGNGSLENLNAGWRTDGTGMYLKAKPPVEWSTEKNVVWKTPLPDFSNASPVIAGNRIFICSEPDTLICLAKKDGKILWKKGSDFSELLTAEEKAHKDEYRKKGEDLVKARIKLARELRGIGKKLKEDKGNKSLKKQQDEINAQIEKIREELKTYERFIVPGAHAVNGQTSPTPVCDGKRVYVNYATGVTAAYTLDGDRVWMAATEKPWHPWGHSSSPVMAGGKVIVYVKNVVALEAATGKMVWQFAPEYPENAQPRWGTCAVTDIGGKTVIITPHGDFLLAADGTKLSSGKASVKYAGPVVLGDKVYFIEHKGKALRLPATTDMSFEPKVLWQTEPENNRYYASPIILDGLIYAITRYMDFSIISEADGKVLHTEKLELKKEAYPSITLAGKYLYISGDKGETNVYKPGNPLELVASNKLEQFRSTPVFEGKRMYIRGYKHMWCIGK